MNEDEFCNEATCERNRAGEKHPKHDLTKTLEKRSKSLANLVKDGAKFGGMPLGAGIGFLFGGPIGATVGAGIGVAIERIGDEIGNRYLAKRERERVGSTIILACEKIKRNVDLGMKYRTDDFFDNKNGERSAAEEVVEGILIASQKEYQEKKLPFYSNLLANLAFHAEIDKAQANLVLK